MSLFINNLRRGVFCCSGVVLAVMSAAGTIDVTIANGQALVTPYGGVSSSGYCADGSCIPNPANFGYYQTGWRRWPTSRPHDLHTGDPRSTPSLPLPEVEVPDPRDEGELNPRPRINLNNQQPPPPQRPLEPIVPPIPELDDSSPELPPLQVPTPEAESQGATEPIRRETIVSHPVQPQLNSQDQIPRPADVRHVATRRSDLAVQVSWENPLRGDELHGSQTPSTWNAVVAHGPFAASEKLEPNSTTVTTPSLAQHDLPEPARIELPDSVTPLPPRDNDYQELGSESDFAFRRNPVRVRAEPVVAPTAFYGDVAENPLRNPVLGSTANPLRGSNGTIRSANGGGSTSDFRNPLRMRR